MDIPFKVLPPLIKNFIVAHPYQATLHIVNSIVILAPAAATVPFFAAMGITLTGPIGGSVAASIMSYFGSVPAGGVYATMQSAAMGGYGASIAAGAAQAGAVVSSAVRYFLGRV